MNLTDREKQRYARQLVLPGMNEETQLKLKKASVLLIGCGGLGSPVALYLAAAGVGKLGLVEFDTVDESNLQRQILHGEDSLSTPKIQSAARRLKELNSLLTLELFEGVWNRKSASTWAREYDIIVDASDNYESRHTTNETAFLLKKNAVIGAVSQYSGQLSVFLPHQGGPCYHCMVPELPAPGTVPTPAQAGIMGAVAGTIGSMQAMEAIKLITGLGTPLAGKLFHINLLTNRSGIIDLPVNPHCPVCQARNIE